MFSARMGFESSSANVSTPGYLNIITTGNTGNGYTGVSYLSSSFDSTGNVVLGGYGYVGGSTGVQSTILTTNSTGTIINQSIVYNNTYFTGEFNQVLVDSSGNYYAMGNWFPTVSGNQNPLVVKLNGSLSSVSWQKSLTNIRDSQFYTGAIGSSYIHCGGYSGFGGALLAKYDYSGTLQYQKTIGTSTSYVSSMCVDSSNNYYAVCASSSGVNIQIFKYNSSDVYQWGKIITGVTYGGFGANTSQIIVDSSGNVIITYVSSSNNIYVLKYNSSGTIQWQKVLGNTGLIAGLTVDTVGNIYISLVTSSNTVQILKLNSSGAVSWANQVAAVGANARFNEQGNGNALQYRNGMVLVLMLESISVGAKSSYVLSVPDDGSRTGTYPSIVYTNVGGSASNSGLTSGTQSDVQSGSTLTDATANVFVTTTSFSQTVTTI